jgi:hypothetical protein
MNFWSWFEIITIFINKTLNLQGIMTFKNLYLFKNDKQKKNVMYWDNYKHLL